MSDKKNKTKPPKLRIPSDQWRTVLNFNKEVQKAFKDFFMMDGGRIVGLLESLSKTYYNLEKQDRTNDEKDYFLSICKPAHDAYDDLYDELKSGRNPFIDGYLNTYHQLVAAEVEIRTWMQVKAIFSESANLSDESFIEVIRKSIKITNDMTHGKKLPRQDDLSKTLLIILQGEYEETGKMPNWRQTIKALGDAEFSSIIQEVDWKDEDTGNVYWKSKKGKEDKTSFKQVRQRLTNIRKKIKKNS